MLNYIYTIIAIALFIAFYCIIVRYKEVRKRKQIMQSIEANWDRNEELNYEELDIDHAAAMYEYYKDTCENHIDDITWNDMEMDGVYHKLNHTYSIMGDLYLYYLLRTPTTEEEELKERTRVVEYFMEHRKERLQKQYQLHQIGKFNKVSIYTYHELIEQIKVVNIVPYILSLMALFITILLVCFGVKWGIGLFVVTISLNTVLYYKRERKTERYLAIIMQLGTLLEAIKEMDDGKQEGELAKYSNVLSKATYLSKRYRRYFRFFGKITLGKLSDLDMLYDAFIKPMFHIDVFVFNQITQFIKSNRDQLFEVYETVGFLDSCISIAEFEHKMRDIEGKPVCKPVFLWERAQYQALDMYYPIIEKPVTNTITTEHSVLITGSNATGKSTFLRTIGVNAILAQSIGRVCATQYEASFFHIMSSMSLRDNVFHGESYYMMEIKALKRIIDLRNGKVPLLCLVDEVLRGTNTIERIAASSKILELLASSHVLCFVASHDLELTYLLEHEFKNYHFQEEVDDHGMTCDFKLYQGRSYTRNAIQLLKFFDFSNEVIKEAKERANSFIEKGKWV